MLDPAFGLPARWIEERDRDRALTAGYAVVDASTALSTHLSEVIRDHAAPLLTRHRVQDLLDRFAEDAPKVVEEIVPGLVSLSLLHRTLRALLTERVSIRDLGTILDTLAEYAGKIQDPDLLTDLVRERLGRAITRPYVEQGGRLPVLTLAPELEEELRSAVQRSESGSFLAVDPVTLDGLVRGVQRAVSALGLGGDGTGPVLLATQGIRSPLRQIIARFPAAHGGRQSRRGAGGREGRRARHREARDRCRLSASRGRPCTRPSSASGRPSATRR